MIFWLDCNSAHADLAHSVRPMKMRILAMLAGVASLLSLSSCIESTQTLHLKKDGSGTIEEETIMSAQMLAMMALGGGPGGPGGAAPDPIAEMMKEDQYKKKAASYGEGVECFNGAQPVEINPGLTGWINLLLLHVFLLP